MTPTATRSPTSAAYLAQARQDTQNYRRAVLVEELTAGLEELCRASVQGENHENRLRAQRKHVAPTLAKLVAYLERQ